MNKIIKTQQPTPYKINCLCKLTYENPRGFSIRFVFTKLVAYTRKKCYATTLPTS
jgi:hypothetical protein